MARNPDDKDAEELFRSLRRTWAHVDGRHIFRMYLSSVLRPNWKSFGARLKFTWLLMLVPPWRHSEAGRFQVVHWPVWLLGWAWAIAGLALGALVAQPLLQYAGYWDIPHQDWAVIAIAIVVGFVVQSLGWCLVLLAGAATLAPLRTIGIWWVVASSEESELDARSSEVKKLAPVPRAVVPAILVTICLLILFALVPLIAVSIGLYLYFTQVAADQRSISIAFAGGLIFKIIVLPVITTVLRGLGVSALTRWLRGKK
jgi:hypothetical protein